MAHESANRVSGFGSSPGGAGARQRLFAAAVLAVITASASAGVFTAPQDIYVSPRAMEAITGDISGGRPSDAVERVEGLFNDPAASLVKLDDGRVVSIKDYVNGQLTDSIFPTRFREQYEKVAGPTAQAALADAAHAGDVTAMLAVAERYPWTIAGEQAAVEAAQRLLALGDVRGVKELLPRISPAAAEKLPGALRTVAALPSDSTLEPAIFSTTFLRAKPSNAAVAPAATVPRMVPVASPDAVYLAAPNALLALNKQGRMLWTIIDPAVELPPPPKEQPKGMEVLNPTDTSLSRAAVWCDVAGVPRVLVSRQTSPLRSSLRAVRPQDGSVIWTTESSGAGGDLHYFGTPTIRGRYVYSMAINIDAARGNQLCLVALDIAGGRLLFKSVIGEAERKMAAQVRKDEKGIDPAQRVIGEFVFRDSTTIGIDGDRVFVTPGGGNVFCVDRFSGALRWIATYPALAPMTPQQEREQARLREKERQERAKKKLPPPTWPVNVRWQNAVASNGSAVIVGPTDSKLILALDRTTGKMLWSSEALADAELVTVRADRVVLATSTKLIALDTQKGDPAWEVELPAEPTGPAYVDGDNVGVVSAQGFATFAINDGQPAVKREPERIVVDALLRTPVARQMFQTAGLLSYFGDPPAEPVAEKPAKPTKPKAGDRKSK